MSGNVNPEVNRIETAVSNAGSGPKVYSGVDVVSIRKVASLFDEFGDSVAERSFTLRERRYCEEQQFPSQHYAARWAAKEAFLKVLDEPSPSVQTNEIEVVRKPSGPQLSLGPQATEMVAARLSEAGLNHRRADHSVSLSHDRESDTAVAHVFIVAPPANDELEGGDRP